GVRSKRPFTIAKGPNNPVGSVWIDLSIDSYGIHGAPEPGKIGTTFSHGCIRLTNWDAEDLAAMIKPGTKVDFKDETAQGGSVQ
ncbi:L,D-transpeptidase, partial [Mesorhizobium sp. M8A.F.Ca.ET.167.01.1.1]